VSDLEKATKAPKGTKTLDMAPGITSDLPLYSGPTQNDARGSTHKEINYPAPLKLSGALEKVSYEDTTPLIGREFLDVNIVDDLLNASNADELIRDLAITSKPYYTRPWQMALD
jgi:hypothetical protein